MESRRLKCVSLYSFYTIEPLCHLHFGISGVVKESTSTYLLSDRVITIGPRRERKVLLNITGQIAKGCDLMLGILKSEWEVSGLCVDF